jgi:hypothetical protein
VEELSFARDAHDGALALMLIFCAAGALFAWTARALPGATPRLLALAWVAASGAASAYLARTRRRPAVARSFALGLVFSLALLAILPAIAVAWGALGRSWEVLSWLHLATVAVVLIAPRLRWIGLCFVFAFTLEAVLLVEWATHARVPEPMPYAEPWLSIVFGGMGVGLALLRDRRRALAIRHLHTEGELAMVSRVAQQFRAIGGELEVPLARLTDALAHLQQTSVAPATIERLARAAERLGAVRSQLGRAGGASAPDATPPAQARAGERLLHAHAVQHGALVLAAIVLVSGVLAVAVVRRPEFRLARLSWSLQIGLALAAVTWLMATRERPTVARGTALLLLVFLPILVTTTLTTRAQTLPSVVTPFEPCAALKLLMVALPLVMPLAWLGAALEALVAGESFVLYQWFHIAEQTAQVPHDEPSIALLYAMAGLVLLSLREQRRLASLALLRAEAELSALVHETAVASALNDQLNSPLQVLAFAVERLRLDAAAEPTMGELDEAVARLREISRQLPDLNAELPPGLAPASFDGAQALGRLAGAVDD